MSKPTTLNVVASVTFACATSMIAMTPVTAVAADYRLGHVFTNESPVGQAATRFAALVKERTKGEVNINVFPSGQIGNDEQLIREVSRGLLQFSFVNHGSAVNLDKRIDFGALPYIATNYDQVDKLFYGNGIIPRTATEILGPLNVHILGWFEQEFRAVSNSRKPIHSVADMKGLKLRVPPARNLRSFFEDAGVQTVTMPITELFTGLQQKTVDGQENGPIQTYTAKLYEATKYMTLTNHAFVTSPIVMSKALRDRLTPEQREIIDRTAKEVSAEQIKAARAAYRSSIDKLRAEKVEVIELTPEAAREMQRVGMKTWDKLADVYGADRIAQLRKEVEAASK
jgi:tripartite ATP-independent transporter DctP family solute receptor